jgi:hypothetical protein
MILLSLLSDVRPRGSRVGLLVKDEACSELLSRLRHAHENDDKVLLAAGVDGVWDDGFAGAEFVAGFDGRGR